MEQFTKHVEGQFQGQETTASCQPLRRTPRRRRPCVDLHHPRRLPAPLRHDLMRRCTGCRHASCHAHASRMPGEAQPQARGRGPDTARDRRLRQPEHRSRPGRARRPDRPQSLDRRRRQVDCVRLCIRLRPAHSQPARAVIPARQVIPRKRGDCSGSNGLKRPGAASWTAIRTPSPARAGAARIVSSFACENPRESPSA